MASIWSKSRILTQTHGNSPKFRLLKRLSLNTNTIIIFFRQQGHLICKTLQLSETIRAESLLVLSLLAADPDASGQGCQFNMDSLMGEILWKQGDVIGFVLDFGHERI